MTNKQCLQDSKCLHETDHRWNMSREFIALQGPAKLKQIYQEIPRQKKWKTKYHSHKKKLKKDHAHIQSCYLQESNIEWYLSS